MLESDFRAIIKKMHECTPDLFKIRMDDFLPLVQNFHNLKEEKSIKSSFYLSEIQGAEDAIASWSLDFLDGPLLLNAFRHLPMWTRKILMDLELKLEALQMVALWPAGVDDDDLEPYNGTNEEVRRQAAEIVRLLRPSQLPIRNRTEISYDDSAMRDAQERAAAAEVDATKFSEVMQKIPDANALFETFASMFKDNQVVVEALIASRNHAHAAPALPPQRHPATSTDADSNEGTLPIISPDATAPAVLLQPALQETYHLLALDSAITTRQTAAYHANLESRFHAYSQAINHLLTRSLDSTSPPPPELGDILLALGIPDIPAAYHRLAHLWTNVSSTLSLPNAVDMEALRTKKTVLYPFAIAMREAHFLLRLLHFYEDGGEGMKKTGWDAQTLRWVQCGMVEWSAEWPLAVVKWDVDIVCHALERVGCVGVGPNVVVAMPVPAQVGQQYVLQPPQAQQQQVGQQYGLQPPTGYQQQVGQQHVVPLPQGQQQQAVVAPAPMVLVHPPTPGMDLIQVQQACPDFKRGICKNIQTCPHDHLESLRKPGECFGLKKGGCKWGAGCSYNHGAAQGQAGGSVVGGAVSGTGVSGTGVSSIAAGSTTGYQMIPNQRGELVDALDQNSYCRNWAHNKCGKGSDCRRVHQHPPQQQVPVQGQQRQQQQQQIMPMSTSSNENVLQGGGQNATNFTNENVFQNGSQQKKTKKPCKFFIQGKCNKGAQCKFSHDIPSASSSDSGMLDTASTTNMNSATPPLAPAAAVAAAAATQTQARRVLAQCPYEELGRRCSRDLCNFAHFDPLSNNYRAAIIPNGGVVQPIRPRNFTYQPNQPVQFDPQQQTQQSRDENWGQIVQGRGTGAAIKQRLMSKFGPLSPDINVGTTQQTSGPVQQQQQNRQLAPPSNLLCFVCGQPGHKKADCPSVAQTQLRHLQQQQLSRPVVNEVCFLCNEPGHRRADCPTRPNHRLSSPTRYPMGPPPVVERGRGGRASDIGRGSRGGGRGGARERVGSYLMSGANGNGNGNGNAVGTVTAGSVGNYRAATAEDEDEML